MEADQDTNKMLDDLVNGFDDLLREMKALRAENAAMQRRLDGMHEKQPTTPAATEDGSERGKGANLLCKDLSQLERLPSVLKAQKIANEWRTSHNPKPLKIELPEGHPQVELEHDFTTPGGTQGKLGCPFATTLADKERLKDSSDNKMGRKGRRPGEPSVTPSGQVRDPIAAELHSKSGQSRSVSIEDSLPQCPIRFLDQHKPEEVAQYFENHKHEIPRSHEICIKRYQSNEQSIRQLDAKYGNLVSMIQGLGKKHMPILEEKVPEEDDEDEDAASQALSDKDIAKIQRWAGDVNDDPVPEPPLEQQLHQAQNQTDDSRKTRFDQGLREVRLGESPSRPWGIQVPAEVVDATVQMPTTKPSMEMAAPNTAGLLGMESMSKLSAGSPMTFNGPVFFGYSADEVMRLLQQVPQLQKAAK